MMPTTTTETDQTQTSSSSDARDPDMTTTTHTIESSVSDGTKRSLGTLIVLSIVTLALSLVAITTIALVVEPSTLSQVISFSQVLIASCISGILGIAVGLGISSTHHDER